MATTTDRPLITSQTLFLFPMPYTVCLPVESAPGAGPPAPAGALAGGPSKTAVVDEGRSEPKDKGVGEEGEKLGGGGSSSSSSSSGWVSVCSSVVQDRRARHSSSASPPTPPLSHQSSDSGLWTSSSSSSAGGEQPSEGPSPASSNSPSPPPSPQVVVAAGELNSEKLRQLDLLNQNILADFARKLQQQEEEQESEGLEDEAVVGLGSSTFDRSSRSRSSSKRRRRRPRAGSGERPPSSGSGRLGGVFDLKDAWRELAGVTPSRRLLQLMRRLQEKVGDTVPSVLDHVTFGRSPGGSRTNKRSPLKNSSLFGHSGQNLQQQQQQQLAVATPSGALVCGGGTSAPTSTPASYLVYATICSTTIVPVEILWCA
ncbi:uncharacterized protein LOC135195051 [Macrobrachium nipponense]|uniref:uncharacterized protein LOC135195051 n=1 Tax=Macrobrachium nipponense TaxID=159736 RepID=UPI0030C8CAF9